jgi:hypothetical protein
MNAGSWLTAVLVIVFGCTASGAMPRVLEFTPRETVFDRERVVDAAFRLHLKYEAESLRADIERGSPWSERRKQELEEVRMLERRGLRADVYPREIGEILIVVHPSQPDVAYVGFFHKSVETVSYTYKVDIKSLVAVKVAQGEPDAECIGWENLFVIGKSDVDERARRSPPKEGGRDG